VLKYRGHGKAWQDMARGGKALPRRGKAKITERRMAEKLFAALFLQAFKSTMAANVTL